MPDLMDKSERERFIGRYLLGQVSQEERDNFEDQYLADDDLFEELVAAENDMIDSYVRGGLSKTEQGQFESHFLNTPERRERVGFARSLASYGAAARLVSTPGWHSIPAFLKIQSATMRFAVVAMFLAVVASGIWTVVNNFHLRRQLDQSQREEQQLRQEIAHLNTQLQESVATGSQKQELAQLDPPGAARLSLVLAPVARGHGGQNTVFISPGISSVAFRLNREREEYSTYGVSLETVEGSQILQKKGLKSQPAAGGGKVITAEFLSKSLNPGDYVLKLTGTTAGGKMEDLDAYSFRVVKP
jgi:cell division protein FtsL